MMHNWRHTFTQVVIVGTFMLGLASCALSQDNTGGSSPITVATYQSSNDMVSPQAKLTGVLANFDGCLVVAGNATGFSMVYFPNTAVSGVTHDGVELFGKTYQLGDNVSFGGGYFALQHISIPEQCRAARSRAISVGTEFTVFQG